LSSANTATLIVKNFVLPALSNAYFFNIYKAKDAKKLRIDATLAYMHIVQERAGLSAL